MQKPVKKVGRPLKKDSEKRHIQKHFGINEAEQSALVRRARKLKLSESDVFRLPLTNESVEEILLTRILDELVIAKELRRQTRMPGTLDDETADLLLKKAGAMIVSYIEQRHAR